MRGAVYYEREVLHEEPNTWQSILLISPDIFVTSDLLLTDPTMLISLAWSTLAKSTSVTYWSMCSPFLLAAWMIWWGINQS